MTGSNGMIGQKLGEALSEDFHVVGLDVGEPQKRAGFDSIECDFNDDASVNKAFRSLKQHYGDRFGSVIHLAGYNGEDPNPRELDVGGTRRLLRALRELHIEQLLFCRPVVALQPWLDAENAVRQERNGFPVTICCLANVYDENCRSLPLARQLLQIHEKRIQSSLHAVEPNHGQPFVHIDDLVSCLRNAVNCRYELVPFEIFLIAEPDGMSHDELRDTLGKLIHGKAWPTVAIAQAASDADGDQEGEREEIAVGPWLINLADEVYQSEIRKTRKVLGCRPSHRLRNTLPEIVARFKRNPRRWSEINAQTPHGAAAWESAEQVSSLLAG